MSGVVLLYVNDKLNRDCNLKSQLHWFSMSLSSGDAKSAEHFSSCPFDISWPPQTCYLIDTKRKRVCSELRVPVGSENSGPQNWRHFSPVSENGTRLDR